MQRQISVEILNNVVGGQLLTYFLEYKDSSIYNNNNNIY